MFPSRYMRMAMRGSDAAMPAVRSLEMALARAMGDMIVREGERGEKNSERLYAVA